MCLEKKEKIKRHVKVRDRDRDREREWKRERERERERGNERKLMEKGIGQRYTSNAYRLLQWTEKKQYVKISESKRRQRRKLYIYI